MLGGSWPGDTAADDGLPSVADAVRGVIDGLGLEDWDVMWPELDFTVALAMRFDRGETGVATHPRPALVYLSRVAQHRALRQGASCDRVGGVNVTRRAGVCRCGSAAQAESLRRCRRSAG